MFVPRNRIERLWPWAGERMIFIHTPKCGGSFVADAFGLRFSLCPTLRWREAAGHRTYREYRDIFSARGHDIHDWRLFTVIRNPWDWHVSWYNYVGKDEGGRHSGLPLEHEQIRNLSFSDYLKWLDDEELPRSPENYLRMQISDWIVDEQGRTRADHVLRQETLESDLRDMAAKYGLLLKVRQGARINASRADRDYRKYYSDADAERIARRHARDIRMFGYSFA